MRRINIVDAAAALVVVGMTASAVAAYMVVRPHPPVFSTMTPTSIRAGVRARVQFTGRHIRPFLQALVVPHGTAPTADPTRGAWVGIGDTTTAALELPRLDAGEYDVHIYDKGVEIARAPAVLIVRR